MIRKQLERLRLRLRAASAAERGTRALFYALLLVCVALVATRLLGLPVPGWIILAVPAATLPAGLLSGWMRRMSLHDCAVLVDRRLGTDDRVATSLEAEGPFRSALAGDAVRALDRKNLSPLGRIRWPRETFFLVISLPLAAFLWFAPSPETGENTDPELLAVAQAERARLIVRMAEADKAGVGEELEAISALLDEPTAEKIREALARLRSLEEKLEKRMSETALSEEERESLRSLAGLVSAGGADIARALEKKGLLPAGWKPLSPAVRDRLVKSGLSGGLHASDRPSGVVVRESSTEGASAGSVRETITKVFERKEWPPRYDTAVQNYFSDDPAGPVPQRRR